MLGRRIIGSLSLKQEEAWLERVSSFQEGPGPPPRGQGGWTPADFLEEVGSPALQTRGVVCPQVMSLRCPWAPHWLGCHGPLPGTWGPSWGPVQATHLVLFLFFCCFLP